jgi:hypothetical protein
MADRETIITHLMIIHTWASFARERDLQFFTEKHLEDITQWTDDALKLLKEQKAVVPTLIREGRNKYNNDYVCPGCDNELFYGQNYCSECGRPVKWE